MGRTSEDCKRNPSQPAGPWVPQADQKDYVTRTLALNLQMTALEKIDIHEPEQVRERIKLYFEMCLENEVRPTVTKLALALGISRKALSATVHGKKLTPRHKRSGLAIPEECTQLIKQAHEVLGAMWEDYMYNGKINPAAGIFLGKNCFGYVDVLPEEKEEPEDDAPITDRAKILEKYGQQVKALPDHKKS